ncbi:MAG: T9SS type A sorting domain-containing protein [Bacteroidales bacterium]|nr:T9SS type A sorting domain-containing protein [Bacteroidales bacterium]
MKPITFIKTCLLAILLIGVGSGEAWGQVNISVGNTITEDFNSLGTTQIATLPNGWKVEMNESVRTVGDYQNAAAQTTQYAGNDMPSNATFGIYNFGAGIKDYAVDRAIGGISTSNAALKSCNIFLWLKNNDSQEISSLTISYNIEKYRQGSNNAGFTIQMYYSNDGENWTSAGDDFKTSFTNDGDNSGYNLAPGVTVTVSSKTLYQTISSNSSLYLAWNYSVSTGSTTANAQALGIDDVVIIANGEEGPPCIPPNLSFSQEQVTKSILDVPFIEIATSDNKTTPITYSSSNEDVAEVDASGKVTLKAVGTSIITVSQEAGTHEGIEYCADEAQYTLTVEPLAAPVAIEASDISTSGFTANWETVDGADEYELSVTTGYEALNEDFNEIVGTGGNDGKWSGQGVAGTLLDGFGDWTRDRVYKGYQCLKIGTANDQGYITTPKLGLNGDAITLTFRAGAWDGSNEQTELLLEITGGGSLSESSVTMVKGAFTKYTVEINNGTADTKITFKGKQATSSRFFLDDVKIADVADITGSPFDNIHTTSKALSGLSSGTTYYYTVKAKANGYESAVSNEIKLVTERRNIVSTATGNWNDASTWVNQEIPGLYDNITIANGHTVSINQNGASCYDLTINNGATLDIHADADLIVENDLVNGGDLNLKSSAIGTASLLHNTNDVSATMDRYISGSWAWHLLGSPVAAQSIDNDWTPDEQDNDYDFYAYDEATATWLNQKVGANGLNSFIPGQGYLIAYEANNPTKPFVGELNNQEVEIAIYKNGSGEFAGYNLVANPYPSGINWNLADRSLFEDDFVYVYNAVKDGGEGYETIDGGEANAFIAPHQGFFVLAKQTATFTFTNYLRQHGGSYFKSSSASLLALRLSNDSYYDLTRIRIREGSWPERDRSDALKFYSLDYRVPQLYSMSEDQIPLMLNSYPFIEDEMAVELGLLIPSEGTYTLAVAEAEGVFDGVSLYVYDKLLDKRHDLSDEGAYSFSADPQDDPMRFTLYFGTVGIEVQPVRDKLHAFVGNGYLNLYTDQASQLDILDIQGRLIQRVQLSGQGLERIPINLLKGVYLLQLTDNYKVRAAKVLVP